MLRCAKCNAELEPRRSDPVVLKHCPQCNRPLRYETYPALYSQPPAQPRSEILLSDKEASCYYHPQKRAAIPCSACGRFICGLCDLEIEEMHLCPDCLHKWKKKGKIKTLENYRLLWDNVALYISMGSFLMFYFAFITAPFVIYITIRHWKSPSSIMGRTKIRFIFAFLFATIQIVGMSVLAYTIVT